MSTSGMPMMPQYIPLPSSGSKNNTGIIIFIMVLILVIAGVAGYFLFFKKESDEESDDDSDDESTTDDYLAALAETPTAAPVQDTSISNTIQPGEWANECTGAFTITNQCYDTDKHGGGIQFGWVDTTLGNQCKANTSNIIVEASNSKFPNLIFKTDIPPASTVAGIKELWPGYFDTSTVFKVLPLDAEGNKMLDYPVETIVSKQDTESCTSIGIGLKPAYLNWNENKNIIHYYFRNLAGGGACLRTSTIMNEGKDNEETIHTTPDTCINKSRRVNIPRGATLKMYPVGLAGTSEKRYFPFEKIAGALPMIDGAGSETDPNNRKFTSSVNGSERDGIYTRVARGKTKVDGMIFEDAEPLVYDNQDDESDE